MKNSTNLFLLGVLCSSTVVAESQSIEDNQTESQVVDYRGDSSAGWFVSGGYLNFDGQVAEAEGIDDGAFYLNGGWEGRENSFSYAVGISGFIMSDNDKFSQRVEDAFGNESNASSSASGFGIFAELGYNFGFENGKTAFEVMAGAETIWADRSIANCSNCFSEDIELDSGFYIKPRFRFYNESGLIVSASYHQYLSGDIENGFSVNFAWSVY